LTFRAIGLGAEKWEEALRWYEKSFSLVPDVSTANRLESVYLKLERKGEAIACWEELAESLPETDPGALVGSGPGGGALGRIGNEAARAYGHGAELEPKPRTITGCAKGQTMNG
jgi:tetratricopeptide (TPR) repeat protein